MVVIYWVLLSLVAVLSAFLIYYYSDPKAALYAKLLVFFSFTASLICFVILPIDIYESSLESSQLEETIATSWKAIFYVNFFMCWLVLPFAQQYQDSGQFTFKKRIRESLIMNGILIGVLSTGALLIVIYLLVGSSFTIGQLPSVFATLVNVFGLVLVSIFMGYGLISFPKECFIRTDYKRLVNRCHRQAEALRQQQQNIKEEMITVLRILQRQERSRDDYERRVVSGLIQQNFTFKNEHQMDEIDKISKKKTADLHKMVKKRILQMNSSSGQIDELVDDLKSITQSYLHNSYKYKRLYYLFLVVVTTIISIIIFFAQLSTFATFLLPANVLRLLGWGGHLPFSFNVMLMSYIGYIVGNSVFRIKVYKVFALHKGHSTASSLLFTAINLSRICYPLCYNYQQITDLPSSGFLKFFGNVTIPVQYSIIFPILMLVFALFNLFDIYDRVAGYLGLSSYAFDDEEAQQKREEGRNILLQRFKERNQQNNRLQMIQLL